MANKLNKAYQYDLPEFRGNELSVNAHSYIINDKAIYEYNAKRAPVDNFKMSCELKFVKSLRHIFWMRNFSARMKLNTI